MSTLKVNENIGEFAANILVVDYIKFIKN
jgi:hypothetical protein